MSTWQIFSDSDNDFRWEISDAQSLTKPVEEASGAPIQPYDSTSRLPSMVDLLLQGCSKILENDGPCVESPPMFRTGFGKSVTVKQSSIAKALSVLGDDDFGAGGQDHDRDNGCGFSNSLFQTGSGKMVNISSAGLVRAKTLLGLEENSNHHSCQEHITKQNVMDGLDGGQNSSCLEMQEDLNSIKSEDAKPVPRPFSTSTSWRTGSINEAVPHLKQSEMYNPAPNPPPIKFHTAGGRSISVSSDALQRARSLLGDPELGTSLNEGDEDDMVSSFLKGSFRDASSDKENDSDTSLSHHEKAKSKHTSKSFISPIRLFPNRVQSSVMPENTYSGSNLIKKYADDSKITCPQEPLSNRLCAPHTIIDNSVANGNCSINKPLGRSSGGPLVDVSNRIGTLLTNKKQTITEKRRLGRRSSISPFKRPRSSKFCPPLNSNVSFVPNGLSTLASEDTCCRKRVSTRYPFHAPRMYIKEYFGVLPFNKNVLEHLSDEVRWMNPDNAEKYMFPDEYGLGFIGVDDLYQRLAQSGASMQYASKEWIANHYKWIIWKLACYERFYPAKHMGRFLTMSNVLEELKYRYEREVNHGHRSAIKRILEGDASPSTMVVLCVSAIHSTCDMKIGTHSVSINGSENSNAAKVELTDGWYSIDAFLDALLSKQLFAGKLFIGQKLRIWGAGLCGWVGPVSPLETSKTAGLLVHINGTYRAHWADRLGFCKGVGPPLAFRCIKSNGGPVPQTLVRVTRIYPILYKERLSNGGSIVRSVRMETKMMQLYNQRCSTVVEGIISEFQRGTRDSCINNDNDSEEGAKIFEILERAAEPEVLMAEMTSEQLASFTSYQAKLEAIRQSDLQKSIEMALEGAGLSTREVTPFMRVRVVGLTCKSYEGKIHHKEGLITIWNPTEKQQQFDLVEGQAYAVAGLMPLNSDSETLYLQARGSTTKWNPLSPLAIEHFEPFLNPRKSVLLSNLGEIPLSSEFDIAALVVYVGEVYTAAHQKKQWVFVTDGSVSELGSEEASNCLLAISFCSPSVDDSFVPVNSNLEGSTVGFVNLIKRAKDQMNQLWVAEATENSDYFFSFDLPHCYHLKNAAASAERWAKISSLTIEKLKEKVLFIIGDCKG
ncbi:protein BREAST CANCER SUSCEPTIBILITY 2 homolog B-like isoform X1 [Vitis riparia]|uniref:protein BREAST CANCER SUSCEPTIBILITY 2 homolog B-like isoform X1 n=1 Tax=Vitis riparia TaxID=96939 RepID=UPI00155A9630|nr:protein BREAST CANCER SUSCEPTIBILITY 2 homolog B-like isoform X1 [Vitis riparia]